MITNDKFILDTISGYRIPFTTVPEQSVHQYPKRSFSKSELLALDSEIKHLLDIKAIRKCKPVQGQFISDIFLVPKSDGDFRFILNLKKLNKYVHCDHFKMEDIRTATRLLSKDCHMVNIDLKEAYFLLRIHESHTKYLRFYFDDDLYEFTVLPFGLCSAPYIFTKILQPVATFLRSKGFISVRYLDDILLISNDYYDCLTNRDETINCLTNLGFVINYKKSNLIPAPSCTYLGFILNSRTMTIELPDRKRKNILQKITFVLDCISQRKEIQIRDFARFLGTLTAACPAVLYGWLYTKGLERAKYLALINNSTNFDMPMTIPNNLCDDLIWWKNKIMNACNPIRQSKFELEIFTDASMTGWGACCNNEKIGGPWTVQERSYHINYLELLAVYYALKSFAKCRHNCEILLRVDNTTAISYLNRMGGVQYPHLNFIAQLIWRWCEKRNIMIFASYIKSCENIDADSESRKLNIDTEWELNSKAFSKIVTHFGCPDIDLFASRINTKCEKYVSWKRDPYAYDIDAFTLDWHSFYFYAFPPFSLVLKVLNKIIADRATGIVVVPHWPSQPWYPLFKSLCVGKTIVFPPEKLLLSSSFRQVHPLCQHLSLEVSVLCGKVL